MKIILRIAQSSCKFIATFTFMANTNIQNLINIIRCAHKGFHFLLQTCCPAMRKLFSLVNSVDFVLSLRYVNERAAMKESRQNCKEIRLQDYEITQSSTTTRYRLTVGNSLQADACMQVQKIQRKLEK